MSARSDSALARLRRLKPQLPRERIARKTGHSGPRYKPERTVWRGVSTLLFFALFVLCVRAYLFQRLDLSGQVEHVLRAQIGPQIEKQLGAKVEFGEVETDWLGRVVVHGIFVGRNARLPTGALLQAQSAIIGLDLPGIALGRAQFPGAIRSVELVKPELYLRRDARGLNWANLLPKSQSKQKLAWSGQISATGGRIYYLDTTLRSASKQPLLLDARGVDARLDALQNAPYQWVARAKTPLFGAQKLQLQPISSQGSLETDFKNGLFSVETAAAPFPVLADYAFSKREIIARAAPASDIGGRLVFTLSRGQLTPQGTLAARNLNFSVPSLRLTPQSRPIEIQSLSGPVEFANQAFSTSGANFGALGTRFRVKGTASLEGNAPFDLDVQTAALPLGELRPFLPRGVTFSSGNAPLSARFSGNALGKTRQIDARGKAQMPAARFTMKSNGARGAFGNLKTDFVASARLRPDNSVSEWKIAARGASPTSQLALSSGSVAAQNTSLNLRAAQGGGIEIGYDARRFNALSPRFGTFNGAVLRLQASAPNLSRPTWSGALETRGAATSGVNWRAISPSLAQNIGASGALDVQAQFSGLNGAFDAKKVRGAATFGLTSLQLDPRAFASAGALPLRSADFSLRALRGRVAFADGVVDVSRAAAISGFGELRLDASVPLQNPNAARLALSIPDLRVREETLAPFLRAQNVDLTGDWRGRVTLLSRAATTRGAAPRFGLDFDLRAPFATLRGRGKGAGAVLLGAPQLEGRAEFPASNATSNWSGNGVVRAQSAGFEGGSLGRLAPLPAEIAGARASGLTLDFAMQNAARSGANSANLAHLTAQSLRVPLPRNGAARATFLTLQNVDADLENGQGGASLPRFAARFAGGEVRGTAALTSNGPRAQFLARGIDAARIQEIFAPDSRRQARVSGLASAKVEVRSQTPLRAQIHLARGAMRVISASKTQVFPLQNARATVLLSSGSEMEVREALVWSDGARLAANATQRGGIWSGNVDFSGARLAKLAALPWAPKVPTGASPDGLIEGNLAFAFDARRARLTRLSGRTDLRLAEVYGAQISALGARVSLQNAASAGPHLAISDLKGQIEGAPVTGEADLDLARNAWSVNVAWSAAQTARVARLQALLSVPPVTDLNRVLPVEGAFGGEIRLAGTLQDARGVLAPRARDGVIRFTSGDLVWRGRTLGALRADISVKDGVARAQTLQLMRVGTQRDLPLVAISGVLPLDPSAPGLDAEIHMASAPLSYLTEALAESRDALRNTGVAIPFFERVVAYVDALPAGTTGQVALDADLSGSWGAPRVRVSNLTLREGRTRIPTGGFSPPATLDAAFTFEKDVLTLEKAEFKIKKSSSGSFARPGSAAASGIAVVAPLSSEEDDTLLRVEPGGTARPDGPISLAADVFNANLSQLSTWVPALRASDGGPLLRGELSEFSFRVEGTTLDPAITGSIQGENLQLENYTLDRLRVARFEIGQGAIRIEPGNLTVVKGAFQSSAAYGTVPWSWALPGPVFDRPIDVHFPFQTRDFGALVGAFVPALSVAEADEFVGSIDVTGTLGAPALSGAITIRGGQFRLDAQRNPLAAGLREVSGTVRFVGATQVLIDASDPLRGRFVPASAIAGRAARSVEPAPKIAAPFGPPVRPRKPVAPPEAQIAGEFVVRGSVERPVQIDALLDPAAALSRLNYDLSVELNEGAFASPGFGGISDISVGLIWKTGAGDAQNVRWMLAARGEKPRKGKNSGTLTSFGALALRRDFGAGFEALAKSGARDFSGEGDFQGLGVFKRVDVAKAPDRRAQVTFNRFAAGLTGAGNGLVDGRLVLDNGAPQQRAVPGAARLQNASFASRNRRARFGSQLERDFALAPRPVEIQNEIQNENSGETPDGTALEDGAPLRLGGVLTLSGAEVYGAPAGGEGAALLLSRLPAAPRFDMRLKMGRDVQIVTAAFRSGLEGELVAQGTPNNPQISGILNTVGGQVRFPNARARVDEGRVTISMTRDPNTDGLRTRLEIDATARGQAGRYSITLQLRGPLDLTGPISGAVNNATSAQSLQIEVTSNPPLSQSEAFQQLLGTVPNLDYDEKTGTYKTGSVNRAYTNAIVNVLSAPLFSGVEQSLAQTLGLTSVGFEYRFNEPLAVQVTKALGDRVFVSYRRSLGSGPTGSIATSVSTGRTPFELRIEYRLRGSYLLGLQTDERQIPSITIQKTRQF